MSRKTEEAYESGCAGTIQVNRSMQEMWMKKHKWVGESYPTVWDCC